MERKTVPRPEQDFEKDLQAARLDSKEGPEVSLNNMAGRLEKISKTIRSSIADNTLSTNFFEKDLRPELRRMAEEVDTIRTERSINIPNSDMTLTGISTSLYKGIIQLNTATNLELSADRPHDKKYWEEYQNCYLDCSEHLSEAKKKIGGIGGTHPMNLHKK